MPLVRLNISWGQKMLMISCGLWPQLDKMFLIRKASMYPPIGKRFKLYCYNMYIKLYILIKYKAISSCWPQHYFLQTEVVVHHTYYAHQCTICSLTTWPYIWRNTNFVVIVNKLSWPEGYYSLLWPKATAIDKSQEDFYGQRPLPFVVNGDQNFWKF